jgi:hypothetical protein
VIIGIRSLATVGIWDYMWKYRAGTVIRPILLFLQAGLLAFVVGRASEERGEEVLLSSVATTTYYLSFLLVAIVIRRRFLLC